MVLTFHFDKLSIKAAELRPDIKFSLAMAKQLYKMFLKTVIIYTVVI